VQVDLPAAANSLATLFAEELGLLLEVAPEHEAEVLAAYADAGVSATAVGSVAADAGVSIAVGGQQHISGQTVRLTAIVSSALVSPHLTKG
jgi:phosphoribosylformylglycinamidine synthase